ncbi:MAG TPA: glycogen debranching N-terminal domain-containing protein [Candidatus Limnocylindrales bacterium]|nr:glycogen debranching N-terminal domain-containing protein [Candidatus Limnocylindrales bacterium]
MARTTAPSTQAPATGVRWLPAPEPTIHPATDLGGVAVLKHRNLYLLTDAFGDIHPDGRGLGLYDLDTRVLSCAVLRMNGVRPTLLRSQTAANHEGTIQLTNPEYRRNRDDKIGEAVERRSLSILRRRWIGDGFGEQITVTNFSPDEQSVVLDLELDVDAADIFEVRGHARPERGRFHETAATDRTLVFSYAGLDGFMRRSYLAFTPGEVTARRDLPEADLALGEGGEGSLRIRWTATIAIGASTDVEWRVWTDLHPVAEPAASLEAERAAVSRHPVHATTPRTAPIAAPEHADAEYRAWTERTTRVDSDGELLDLAIHRSVADLRLLMNDGPRPGVQYVAAGVPWFSTLFGRDTIITALEALPFMPELAIGTLRVLADWQATDRDPDRDMAPGKILHELRSGEMVRTGEIPHRPYYGSVDATPLWLVLLGETTRWTGDLDLVRELWPNVLAALAWIDGDGDPDGDGFVEYLRGGSGGLFNQGWKDSSDSIRHRDGAIARPPIALVEVQGYVYDAKLQVAELARRLGDAELADRLEAEAAELRRRFDAAFWMPDLGYYAVALDADKRPVGSITSNPAHGLWSGIVPADRVAQVAERLMSPELDSGWGLRTYAAGQPGFNPIGYHTGSIWPHDNAIAAAGLKRAGRHDEANRVATRIFEAARHSPEFRLPELFCGFTRDASSMPVPYPVACSPQAWAAAAPLSLLQSMLGLRARASEGVLELDRPHLPSWLGKVTVSNLRVGSRTVDLLFHRWRGTTSAEVLRRSDSLDVVIRV